MLKVRTSIATAFALVSLGGSLTLAQLSGVQTETLKVPIGSIFEIQAAVDKDARANWVLTENGEFIEASREHVFRTRFSKEGTFGLAAELQIGERTVQRMFTLEVRAKRPEDRLVADGPKGIVAFEPPLNNGTLSVSRSNQVVTITPVRADVNVLAIDLDTSVDTNGDGNTENDEDTKNTLFRSEGNPIRIWFVGGEPTTIRFGALLEDNSTAFETIAVGIGPDRPNPEPSRPTQPVAVEDDEPSSTIETRTDMKVLVLKSDNGEVQYALRRPTEMTEPILLIWDFGDGTQSMLDRPIHTYAESGKYDINVEVRNLRTGEAIGNVRDSIMVNRLKEDTPTQTPDGETGGNTEDEKPGEGGSMLGLVLKLIFTAIAFAVLGALISFVIGKVKNRGFSLEKTMEKAEQTMVKTPSSDVSVEPPPMEIPTSDADSETPEDVAPPVEVAAEEVVPEPPAPEPAPAPPAPEPQPEPTPEPPAPPPPPPPPPAPEPQPASQPTQAPEWLSAGLQQAKEQTAPEPTSEPPAPVPEPPAPQPEPTPQPPAPAPEPAPAAPPTEVAENVPHDGAMQPNTAELETNTNNAPDWLQQGMQQAEAVGQTPDAPPPPNLQDPAPVEPAVQPPSDQPAPEAAPAPAADADQAAKEAATKERKRKKRQRYRENVKKRKAEQNATETPANPNEPVAFITAEDIEPANPTPPQENPIPPAEEPPKES